MGGFGSGGKRVGAGRKSKTKAERKLTGARSRTAAKDAGAGAGAAVPMPKDLLPSQAAVWRELAPHATSAGTLIPATVWAFRDLCEAIVLRRQMAAQLELDGLMVNVVKVDEETGDRYSLGDPKAHPLITHERGMRVRVEAGMLRFNIAPMGKSVAKVDVPEDPFAQFEGLSVVKGGKK